MSARQFFGVRLDNCGCGDWPMRRQEFVAGGTALHWVICQSCGARTAKEETEADAEAAWNEGDVMQAWQLPIGAAPAAVAEVRI